MKLILLSGRMALLVTLFLVLVNIFNSVTANAPKAEGLTAVETWVVSCIIHVFGVLAEYALILKIIQAEKRRDAKVSFNQFSTSVQYLWQLARSYNNRCTYSICGTCHEQAGEKCCLMLRYKIPQSKLKKMLSVQMVRVQVLDNYILKAQTWLYCVP